MALLFYYLFCADVFFVVQVYLTLISEVYGIIIFCMSVGSVLVPLLINFVQLHNAIQLWVTDVETKRIVQSWIQKHLRALYAMSIIFGSAFTAVAMCNSNLFSLSIFDMGLNRRQKALFKNQRLYSIILFENVPQECDIYNFHIDCNWHGAPFFGRHIFYRKNSCVLF